MTTRSDANANVGSPDISLFRGGPLYRSLKATKLIRPNQLDLHRQIIFTIAIGWVPLLLIILLFQPQASMSFLRDYRIHSRMLIAVPVLLMGQGLLESRFCIVVEHLRNAQLLVDPDLRENELMVGLRRLRDSALPELVILLLVGAHSYLSFSGQLDASAPWLATPTGAGLRLTPAGWYCVLISASIFQFLLGMSLWKWLLWSTFAFKLSNLRLNLLPAHPDGHGGLGFLGLTPSAFASIAFAASTVIGATWRHQILHHNAHLRGFELPAIALVAIVAALALLPLVFFVPQLSALRRKGILEYSILGQIEMTEFDKKWITHRAGREAQVLTEIESSNVIDFSQIYDRVKQLVPIPVERYTLIPLALSIVVPALPAILAEIPVADVLNDLLKALR